MAFSARILENGLRTHQDSEEGHSEAGWPKTLSSCHVSTAGGHLRQREQIFQRHKKHVLSWLRAMRWTLCSLGYIFSADLRLQSCSLGSLPLHFSVFCLQGWTLFLTDLRRPGGVPGVPERFTCWKKEEEERGGNRSRRTQPQCRILLSKAQLPGEAVHKGSWHIKLPFPKTAEPHNSS